MFWFLFVLVSSVSSHVIEITQPINVASQYYVVDGTEYLITITNLTDLTDLRPPRVTATCNDCSPDNPVLVVVRQNRGVLSWTLPLQASSSEAHILYTTTQRTLCPYDIFNTNCSLQLLAGKETSACQVTPDSHALSISLSTDSRSGANISLAVTLDLEFVLKLNDRRSVTNLTVSTPRYLLHQFSNGSRLRLLVSSQDDVCMKVSVQDADCPVFDLERDVQFQGQYQSVTRQGSITVTKNEFPRGFYVVFVVVDDDSTCHKASNTNRSVLVSPKTVDVLIEETLTDEQYGIAVVITISAFLVFYIVILTVSLLCFMRSSPIPSLSDDHLYDSQQPSSSSIYRQSVASVSSPEEPSYNGIVTPAAVTPAAVDTCSVNTDSSLDEADLDLLPDAELDKNVVRTKSLLCLSDLAKKNPTVLKKKSQLYFWNLFTVFIFYFLPVVQLVITYQKFLNQTGNQDLCYYNFLCANPWFVFSDWNHVISNIGYVLLGILFMGITLRKERLHCARVRQLRKLDRCYGIPQHFGLFYTMGAALIAEGALSASYHVCPNHYNFQFDTSFMYVISTICILKIYQTRHPDINATAYTTFLVMAFVIFLGMLGVVVEGESDVIWHLFNPIYICLCLYLSLNMYYMGRWSFGGWKIAKRVYVELRAWVTGPRHPWRSLLPTYPARFCLLVFANVCNWLWIIFSSRFTHEFATYLLGIFMGNLLIYYHYYIIMKLVSRERIELQPLLYTLLALVCWSVSLYIFYFKRTISWKDTPAESRTYNSPCLGIAPYSFYDYHDIWHFLSAAAMFFSFMVLLTLDDDLTYVHRTKIPVF